MELLRIWWHKLFCSDCKQAFRDYRQMKNNGMTLEELKRLRDRDSQ